MTYLPPKQTPITEYSAVVSLFETSWKLRKNANDVQKHSYGCSAAIKAYHVVWNDADYRNDIIIHSGYFHSMMAVLASLVPL